MNKVLILLLIALVVLACSKEKLNWNLPQKPNLNIQRVEDIQARQATIVFAIESQGGTSIEEFGIYYKKDGENIKIMLV
jgi:hypothetical protein